MKRNVLVGKIASISLCVATALAASCNWLPEELEKKAEEATIVLNFVTTKASGLNPDDFYLTVVRTETENKEAVSDTAYSGKYGKRPSEMKVKAGNYVICAVSDTTAMPAISVPVYGDKVNVTVKGGQKADVSLMCKMTNSGLKLTYSQNFVERYADNTPVIMTSYGSLPYPISRSGLDVAYFESGTVHFTIDGRYLFSRELAAGEVRHLLLDAASDRSGVGVDIVLDETVSEVEDSYRIGDIPVLNVAAAKALPYGLGVTVRGKVVGVVSGSKIVNEAAVSTNIVLADTDGEHTLQTVLPVELKNSQQKQDLAFESVVGKYVTVSGTLEKRYGTTSLTSLTAYAVQ